MILNICRPASRLTRVLKLIFESSSKKIHQPISSSDYLVWIFWPSFPGISDPANSKLNRCSRLWRLLLSRISSRKPSPTISSTPMRSKATWFTRPFPSINSWSNSNSSSPKISYTSPTSAADSTLTSCPQLSREISWKTQAGILLIRLTKLKFLKAGSSP